jgi:hypothetical protein
MWVYLLSRTGTPYHAGFVADTPIGLNREYSGEIVLILNVYIEDRHYPLDVPEALLSDAEEFYAKMDSDMDQGWQMSRQWVDKPSTMERCQIVADKLAMALNADNPQMVSLMGGYILTRMPGVKGVQVDASGEIQETEFIMGAGAA